MHNIKIFHKRKIYLLLIVIIIFFIIFLIYKYPYLFCNRTKCISLNSINTWKEQEIYENNYSKYKALLIAPEYLVRIEKNTNLSKEDANTLILVDVMKIKGLLDNAPNPYTGAISDEISCEDKYKPNIDIIYTNNIEITYYAGWLNNRLQYGVCLDDQLTHKAYNALFYCPNQKTLYHLEFIVPVDKSNDSYFINQIQSIKCQNPLLKIGNILP